MDHQQLFSEIEALRGKYERILLDVCNIESPTDCKEGVDAAAHYFAHLAEELGFLVEWHREEVSGDVAVITMNAESKRRPVAFSGHLDTVHPIGVFGYPPARIEGDRLYGPGAADCKGGCVAALLAMEALKNCGFVDRPVMLLLQSDEENGSRTSEKRTIGYICERAKDAIAFLNCEGYVKGFLCLERKGILKYEFRVHGRAAHASVCGDGVSAIAEAAHKILELEKLRDGGEWGVTCNCGLISGGTAINSVPAECVFTADIRVTNAEDEREVRDLVERIAATSYIPGSTAEAVLLSRRAPMARSEKNLALLSRMNEVYGEVGLPTLAPRKSSGGSDAADATEFGIPTVDSIGVGGDFIHSVNEFATLSSIPESAKRLAAVAAYLGDD